MSDRAEMLALAARAGAARASANVLVGERLTTDWAVRSAPWSAPYASLLETLRCAAYELNALAKRPTLARRLYTVLEDVPDSLDWLHRAAEGLPNRWSLSQVVVAAAWDAVRVRLSDGRDDEALAADPRVAHTLAHASEFCTGALAVLRDYLALLASECAAQHVEGLPRALSSTLPDAAGHDAFESPRALSAKDVARLREAVRDHDLFSYSRTYRATLDGVLSGPVGTIRAIERFYGYRRERETMARHMDGFIKGESIPPLLVTGMPGMGKTHLTIATALARPEIVLVTAEARHLEEPLENLMGLLASHPHRRFVVFFDDIDPEGVEWSTFRNQIEGYLPAPATVAMIIATNGEFSARIRSRCATCAFRPMNPEVCQEFISDYLHEHRWMSQPYPNLVSTVAADFAAAFKKGILSELSPRSLIRYFESLENDKDKIRGLIRESLDEVVRVPSEDPFNQSNRQIMERLRREKGGALGLPPDPPESAARPFFGQNTSERNASE